MRENTITQLPDPSGFSSDPFTDVLRDGARKLIEQAIHAELSTLMNAYSRETLEDGHPSAQPWDNAARSATAADLKAPPHSSPTGTVPAASASFSSHREDRERWACFCIGRAPYRDAQFYQIRSRTGGFSDVPLLQGYNGADLIPSRVSANAGLILVVPMHARTKLRVSFLGKGSLAISRFVQQRLVG